MVKEMEDINEVSEERSNNGPILLHEKIPRGRNLGDLLLLAQMLGDKGCVLWSPNLILKRKRLFKMLLSLLSQCNLMRTAASLKRFQICFLDMAFP